MECSFFFVGFDESSDDNKENDEEINDMAKLRKIKLGAHVLDAPEYCHANFTNHFTAHF